MAQGRITLVIGAHALRVSLRKLRTFEALRFYGNQSNGTVQMRVSRPAFLQPLLQAQSINRQESSSFARRCVIPPARTPWTSRSTSHRRPAGGAERLTVAAILTCPVAAPSHLTRYLYAWRVSTWHHYRLRKLRRYSIVRDPRLTEIDRILSRKKLL